MPKPNPLTALEAASRRRLPLTAWPWRSAGYLFVTPLSALVAAALLAVPAVPWLVLWDAGSGFGAGTIVFLLLLGAVLVAALGPLIAIPVALAARWRLPIADRRPAVPVRRAYTGAGSGVTSWLRARYTDPAAWRETGYACLLATVVPALCAAGLLFAGLAVVFITSPAIVAAGGGPVALAVTQVQTPSQAVPYVFAGVVMLVLAPYVVTLAAGADAAVCRALLFAGPEDRLRAELTEVSASLTQASASLTEVSASRARLADAFEAERRRIERDLHDGAQQRLVALTMQLGLARLDLPDGSPAAAAVTAATEQAKQLMAEMRELIHGIQPQILTDLGLPAALTEVADSAPLPVSVDASLPGRLPGAAENTAYFAVAEALTNVAKHSGAASARVSARLREGTLIVEVTDDGHGGADPARGTGLTGLADRVAVAGGRMLLSSPPGGPTVLRVEVPCPQTSPVTGPASPSST